MKISKPLVSVIMPNYNNEKYLPEAIESILNQTYKNFEFIIIDDCSRDSSWEIIQSYAKKDRRIRAFRNDRNLKIVKTRNKGFKLMSKESKYVAIFDSDDISMPERLDVEVSFLEENSDFGLVGANTLIINEKSKIVSKRYYENNFRKLMKNILFKSPVAQPVCMIRRDVLDKVGFYSTDGKFDRSRDFDLWVRIAQVSKVKNLNKFLLKYRVTNTQGKKTHLKETIKSTLQVQKKWAFKREYWSLKLWCYIFMEKILSFFPERFVLWLFKRLEYRK
ncbi:MAG: glycosyltransferase family 2 protein [Nanoarchaeota archaeon]